MMSLPLSNHLDATVAINGGIWVKQLGLEISSILAPAATHVCTIPCHTFTAIGVHYIAPLSFSKCIAYVIKWLDSVKR